MHTSASPQSLEGHVVHWRQAHLHKWWPMLCNMKENSSYDVTCATYHDLAQVWLGIQPCAWLQECLYIFENMVALAARMSAFLVDGFPWCLAGGHPRFPRLSDLFTDTFIGCTCRYAWKCQGQSDALTPPWLLNKDLRKGLPKDSNLQCMAAIMDQNAKALAYILSCSFAM